MIRRPTPPRPHRLPPARDRPLDARVSGFAEARGALAEATESAATDQPARLETLRRAMGDGDVASAGEARNALWDTLLPVFQRASLLAGLWNVLAPRADESR